MVIIIIIIIIAIILYKELKAVFCSFELKSFTNLQAKKEKSMIIYLFIYGYNKQWVPLNSTYHARVRKTDNKL